MPRNAMCCSCNKNHASDFFQDFPADLERVVPIEEISLCSNCRGKENTHEKIFENWGKGPSTDCRFQVWNPAAEPYQRPIPGSGLLSDYDLPAHTWNCKGHSHCRHGLTGVVEDRALTFMRDSTTGYKVRSEVCCGTVWCMRKNAPPSQRHGLSE